MARHRRLRFAACAVLVLVAATTVGAQEPEPGRIDTRPKLEIRPPGGDAPGHGADHPGSLPPEDVAPAVKPNRDRRTQLELEQKERRDTLPRGGKPGRDYLALAVIVAGTALILLLVVVLRSRGRNR